MGNGTCAPFKAKNRHQRWHHSFDRILFNQHIFSSYITSIMPKYVDKCTINILRGKRAGVMTPSVPLSFYEQHSPLPKPLLLLPPPHPSRLSPNKNFGHRLNLAWTLFCINFCSLRDTDERVILSGKYNKNKAPFLLAYRVGLRSSQSIRQSM